MNLFEMFDESKQPTLIDALRDFLPIAIAHLELDHIPKIKLVKSLDDTTFGRYVNDEQVIYVVVDRRNPVDVLRTLAHEMVHYAQGQDDQLTSTSGDTGSPIENEANAEAGVIMRLFNQKHPSYMQANPIALPEAWSKKYKDSINCSNPKGFSQKAHCAGKKKTNETEVEEGIVDKTIHVAPSSNHTYKVIKSTVPDVSPGDEFDEGDLYNYANHFGYTIVDAEVTETKQRLDPNCWKGYRKQGTKIKGGVRVNNCVPNESVELEEEFNLIESVIESLAVRNQVDAEVIWEDLESLTEDELYVFAVTQEPINEDWQKVNKKDKTDGMSKKAVASYRRENPGSKLKTAVTTKPSKLKKGSKASKRRKSYCSRSKGQMNMHNISCAKTPDKAICKARRRWNC
jgi:hypothetical protein